MNSWVAFQIRIVNVNFIAFISSQQINIPILSVDFLDTFDIILDVCSLC